MDPAILLAVDFDTQGITVWAIEKIVPLICLFIGLGIAFGAKKGRYSEGLSTVGVLLLGLIVVALGAVFYTFAEQIAGLAFS